MKRLFILLLIFAGLRASAQTYPQCVRKALDYLAVDSMEQAKAQFKAALRLEPNTKANTVVYRYLGRIYEMERANQTALDSYTKGLRIEPKDTALLFSRASLFLRVGNEDRAAEDYSTILSLHPDCEDALLFRAYAYSLRRKFPAARRDYEAILQGDPLHENARLGLVVLNNKDRRPREAMEGINLLIEHYPTHSSLYLVRAGLEEERKQYETARHDYDQAVRLAPEDAEPLMARARFLLKLGERKEAIADLKRALDLGAHPDEVATLMHDATGK